MSNSGENSAVPVPDPVAGSSDSSSLGKTALHIRLLLQKRYLEVIQYKSEIAKLIIGM